MIAHHLKPTLTASRISRGAFHLPLIALVLTALCAPAPGGDAVQEAADPQAAEAWLREHWEAGDPAKLPIVFELSGKSSRDLLGTWQRSPVQTTTAGGRTVRVFRWTDPASGLELQVDLTSDRQWPVVEWIGTLRNIGRQASPELRNLLAADLRFSGENFTLHGIEGDSCSEKSFQPYVWSPQPGASKRVGGQGGKSSGGEGWPYFNLAGPGPQGRMLVLGWPGQWSARFLGESSGVRWMAGQELTRFQLEPGEKVRFPSVSLLFWRGGDWVLAQNLWRRWYRQNVLPRTQGELQKAVVQTQANPSESFIPHLQNLINHGVQPDLCWRDAGDGWWTLPKERPFPKDAFLNTTGFWEPDPVKFPKGFVPFADWIHPRGMQLVVWFEPERVAYTQSSAQAYSQPVLATNHPEWLLPGGSHGSYFHLGNPEALAWLTGHLSDVIQKQKIDWYRVDFNGAGPLAVWKAHDAREKERTGHSREGLTENFYIQGLLALWDGLRERNPHLRIDSCASGGRRNDLESMRRAVPLLRSDFEFPDRKNVVAGNQGLTFGLSFWLPFYGGGSRWNDPYGYRSCYMPSFGMIAADVKTWKQAYDEVRLVGPHMLMGDYYPLTAYSLKEEDWIAWQFHRADLQEGVIQAFRRPAAVTGTLFVKPRGLEPGLRYEIVNLDGGSKVRTGAEIMSGLEVTLREKPGAAILVLRRTK
jgi:alpha-galactosidase